MANNNSELGFSMRIDMSDQFKTIERDIKKSAEFRIKEVIKKHFGEEKGYSQGTFYSKMGPGAQEIDDMLTRMFIDPKTNEMMEKYFKENFETQLKEAMDKAMAHRANKFAFSKIAEIDEAIKKSQ